MDDDKSVWALGREWMVVELRGLGIVCRLGRGAIAWLGRGNVSCGFYFSFCPWGVILLSGERVTLECSGW